LPAKPFRATLEVPVRQVLLLIASLTAALWAAAPALGGETSARALELSRRGDAFVPPASVPRFTLAGIHWRGSGEVRFRTRSVDGTWSFWRPGAPEAEDGPDPLSAEADRAGWRLGSPWWTGASDGIQVRAAGDVTRVRAELVWSQEARIPYRRVAATETPAIVSRAQWGANESIRRAAPTYARAVRVAYVHHTAGANDYTRSEAPAVVRAIQLYHVRGNGWNDIGYNFLVDRFGTIYEGRYGGVDQNVVGAHALGFNTGSVGIALLGTYGTTKPSAAAQDAIARLLAWRLDVAHVDPMGTATLVSAGSEKVPVGAEVSLRVVSGHRDTGATACPGDALYARLPAIAASARAIGGQKIFDPRAEASGSSVRIRGRLAQPGSWSVVIADGDGMEVARGSGSTASVDWTWDSSSAPAGTYSWSISSGAARPAAGAVKAGTASTALAVSETNVDPGGLTPNGDGQGDSARVTFKLSKPASVTVTVTDAFGALVATVLDRAWMRAGVRSVEIGGDALADGAYTVGISARTPAGEASETSVALTVSRTLGLVSLSPAAFSPNGDGRNDALELVFSLTAPASVRVRVEREGRWVATPLSTSLSAGEQQLSWDGARPTGGALRDGSYGAVVEVTDAVGTVSFTAPFVVDTAAPRVSFLAGRGIRLRLSEPASLTLRIDGRLVQRDVARAGVVRIPWTGAASRVRAVARDVAGNTSAPVVRARGGTR
jgi:hypothetical protein